MLASEIRDDIISYLGLNPNDGFLTTDYIVLIINQEIPSMLTSFSNNWKTYTATTLNNEITVPADLLSLFRVKYGEQVLKGYRYQDYINDKITDSNYYVIHNDKVLFPNLEDGEEVTLYYRNTIILTAITDDVPLNAQMLTALKMLIISNYFLKTHEYDEHRLFYARYTEEMKKAKENYNRQIRMVGLE